MELIRNLYNIKPKHRSCIATIGNFDGVHLGHQAIIKQLNQWKAPSLVICFEPHPAEYFNPENSPSRLTRLREKLFYFAQYGIDYVLCLPFNKQLSEIPPHDFIQNILIKALGIQHLVIGQDFQFGHNRKGDIQLLENFFTITQAEEMSYKDKKISSTRIRTALQHGDLPLAKHLLGRPYSIQGRVMHGDQRGRQIGFPTANIHLGRKRAPLSGVFAVSANGMPGVANIGSRPTVDGTRTVLEVHLFDFCQSIYHQHLQVEFLQKLRDERRFDSLAALTHQITEDAAQAKRFIYNFPSQARTL
ncbi:MAG: bifunctional riboflavin kinase/FAD synthetase [Gammaproteobacteria bacterium]